ncbi:MAG: hypothetical protein HRU29_11435 [Rhizobiales bacterium]|nr:hypothetical protein [Hyphomicrobiales bacterium]NRB15002.1 hypothetical protein [Hyphomicrobiales bacterium]
MSEIYFEHHQIGKYFKTVAIDGRTGVEVSISGPIITPQGRREELAYRKLLYVLQKATQ